MNKPFRLSVKVVILNDEGKLLLIKRSMSSKGNPGKWDFPGGKVDTGETFDEGLLREVFEETRLKISIERPLYVTESESPVSRVVYLFMEGKLKEGEVSLSEEHEDHTWVVRAELSKMDLATQFIEFGRKYQDL
ncbi:MAG: NUDIX domain-containing protein [Candidatus Thermoplasmatota archaeon]|nr:NUDIX domain-containing protein [Candidatus Thermoplasmatota archaeon]